MTNNATEVPGHAKLLPRGEKKRRFDWEDPTVPVGNAPPFPRWPLLVAGLAWLTWVVFLLVMVFQTRTAPPV